MDKKILNWLLIIAIISGTVYGIQYCKKREKGEILKPVHIAKSSTKNNSVIIKNNRGTMELTEDLEAGTIIEPDLGKHKVGVYMTPIGIEFGYNYELAHIGDFSLNVGTTRYFPIVGINFAIRPHLELGVGIGVTGVCGGLVRL